MKAVSTPCFASHLKMARETDSGPLPERIGRSLPLRAYTHRLSKISSVAPRCRSDRGQNRTPRVVWAPSGRGRGLAGSERRLRRFFGTCSPAVARGGRHDPDSSRSLLVKAEPGSVDSPTTDIDRRAVAWPSTRERSSRGGERCTLALFAQPRAGPKLRERRLHGLCDRALIALPQDTDHQVLAVSPFDYSPTRRPSSQLYRRLKILRRVASTTWLSVV